MSTAEHFTLSLRGMARYIRPGSRRGASSAPRESYTDTSSEREWRTAAGCSASSAKMYETRERVASKTSGSNQSDAQPEVEGEVGGGAADVQGCCRELHVATAEPPGD